MALMTSVAEMSFGGAFLWYLVKFIISVIVAFCAIKLGIALRKRKNEKEKSEREDVVSEGERA